MMLHLNSVSKELFGLLKKLCTVPFLANFSLGGGTSLRRLFLNAAPMGEPLYSEAGFVEQDEKALILELS
jgi:hypothetical protein